MEFSRQEYWSGLPFPTSGDLPDPGIKAASLVYPALAGGFFTTEPPGKPHMIMEAGKSKIYRVGWKSGDPGELMLQFKSKGI